MSVRNQYARNHTKVSPFPPSNKLIVEAKVTARKTGASKAKTDREAMTVDPTARKVAVIDKHALDNMTKKTANVTGNEQGNKQRKDGVNVEMSKNEGVSDKTVPDSVNTSNGSEVLRVLEDEHGRLEQDVLSDTNGSINNPKTQDDDNPDWKPTRPKSARPESRWERRAVNPVFDSNDRQQSKPIRPKSARPESRMLRMMEAYDQSEFSGKDDLPQRPKTSYGRRRGSGPDSEFTLGVTERPKSRLGSYGNDRPFESDERDIQPKKRDKKSKQHHKTDRTQSFSRQWHDDDGGVYSSSPQENFSTWRSKTVLDLNSGIDDIDLDVDPVLYFMQDDNTQAKSAFAKHSLSKDTINFIGNTKLQRQGKSSFGYHDNYLDKSQSAIGKQDRFHGTKVNNVKNSILDSDRFSLNNSRRSKPRNDPFVKDKMRTPHSGEMPFTDSFPDTYNYLKLNRPREIINECRGQHSSDDGRNGRHPGNVKVASDNRSGASYRRHPRKLQPISAALSDNT